MIFPCDLRLRQITEAAAMCAVVAAIWGICADGDQYYWSTGGVYGGSRFILNLDYTAPIGTDETAWVKKALSDAARRLSKDSGATRKTVTVEGSVDGYRYVLRIKFVGGDEFSATAFRSVVLQAEARI